MKLISTERFKKIVGDYIFLTFKEFVLVMILTCFFIFSSFVVHTRTEPGPIVGFIVVYFGFPVEWFRITANQGSWYSILTKTEILWSGLVIDIILFILLSIVLVRVIDKIVDVISPIFSSSNNGLPTKRAYAKSQKE